MKKITNFICLFIIINCVTDKAIAQWSAVGGGIPLGWVYAMAEYNGELYIAGKFDGAYNPGHNIARWNGTSWSKVGDGIDGWQVSALTVYKGELYAGGEFTKAGGNDIRSIARWDGTSWKQLGQGFTNSGPKVFRLFEYNGELIICGKDLLLPGYSSSTSIMKWDGTTFKDYDGNGIFNNWAESVDGPVHSILPYNSAMYIGGNFGTVGIGPWSVKNIAKWNSGWNKIGIDGFGNIAGTVYALAEYDNKLFVGGAFYETNSTDTMRYLATWDGSGADNPGNLRLTTGGEIRALLPLGGKLYIAGVFEKNNNTTMNSIMVWDGTKYESMDNGMIYGMTRGNIYCMAEYKGQLYVAGGFNKAGSVTAKSVAKWTGPLTISDKDNAGSIRATVFPNPFTKHTTLEFNSKTGENVIVETFDITGQKINTVYKSAIIPGKTIRVDINLENHPAGLYYCRISSRSDLVIEKLILTGE